jgi:NADH:ubiquinone oxidoreductase subunit E
VDEPRRDLARVLGSFPRAQTYLVPVLLAVRDELGFLPPWALTAVGEHLGLPAHDVGAIARCYPDLRWEAPGEHLARVCTGLSCVVRGAHGLLAAVEAALGVRADGTTEDRHWTLETRACLLACPQAPVLDVDGETVGGLTPTAAAAYVQEVGRTFADLWFEEPLP